MLKNYLKTVIRNFTRNKSQFFINIAGLSVGMTVAILIGLWIWNEFSYNRYHKNYQRIARVKQHVTNNGEVQTWTSVPYPLAAELRKNYGSDFTAVVMGTNTWDHILAVGDKKLMNAGAYFEPAAPEVFSLNMLKGKRDGLKDPSSVILSQSAATALFGNVDPMNKLIKMDNDKTVKVAGVYEDLPHNSDLRDLQFIAPWDLYFNNTPWIKTMSDPWRPNAFVLYAQLAANADMAKVSVKIKDAKLNKVNKELAKKKPVLFLHPMSQWHLYSEFKNGVNTGGRIQYVWMFGIIGVFVLLLACINFMNLSTARSEKRAKEVGIRKTVGSLRIQLIYRFFSESILIVLIAFVLSLGFVQLALPFFNEVADEKMMVPWSNPVFWMLGIGFSLFTGLIAGSYPAFYLSSFQPVKVLKGTFRAGRWAAVPRKVLVVLQFTVSVIMIIGTIIIFNQVQFAKNRPLGYNSNGLVTVSEYNSAPHDHFEEIKSELQKSGTIISMAEASSPTTEGSGSSSGFTWPGKDPNLSTDFLTSYNSHDYGKTIDWQLKEGRDFSKDFATDSSAVLLNESAANFMGLKKPVGETIHWFDQSLQVIGVVKDMVIFSPYEQARPTVYFLSTEPNSVAMMKINPASGVPEALKKIETVFKRISPEQPFQYQFADTEFSKKFGNEERIGKLAGVFAILAIFISCLGLFGMASFMAEQRIKEIGVRKVLGASVFNLWQLLSKDFVMLVVISLFIATPIAYYFMHSWLQDYTYRTSISWWVFLFAGLGAMLITLLTVSYQSVKAALTSPAKSLKTE
jgi:putative ABC transport system permease protein